MTSCESHCFSTGKRIWRLRNSPDGQGCQGDHKENWQRWQSCIRCSMEKFFCLADFEPTPIVDLWPGRVQIGSVSILEGNPEQAKTTLVNGLATCVTRGS